jgi:hypothetical protein
MHPQQDAYRKQIEIFKFLLAMNLFGLKVLLIFGKLVLLNP